MPMPIFILGSLITGFVIALIICYFLPKEKVKSANQELDKQEQQKQLEIKTLESEYYKKAQIYSQNLEQTLSKIREARQDWDDTKQTEINQLAAEKLKLIIDVNNLKSQQSTLNQEIEDNKKLEKESIEHIQQNTISSMTEEVLKKSQDLYASYEKLKSDLLSEYTQLNNENFDNFIKTDEELTNKITEKENTLHSLCSKVDTIADAIKRIELEQQKKDFYRLQLSTIDIEEIQKIRSIEPYLRNKEPLNKVIWKVYYEKPYTDLIARVLGAMPKTGIYKITNLKNGLCYVGQAVNVADRWRQHIKRGIGAETPTRNKLYPAMLEDGVENFTFELLQECKPTELNELEDYYQQVFHAKEGYSIK